MKMIQNLFLLLFILTIAAPARSGQQGFSLRINAGGGRYTDSAGNEWLRDYIFNSTRGYGYLGISGKFTTTSQIANTVDQSLYQSECHKLHGYRVKVPNGHYKVVLHFAEIYHTKKNQRVMDIKLEGKLVGENIDIFAAVGANSAHQLKYDTKTLNAPVTDGNIDIEFIKKKDETKLSAIEVVQLADQPMLLNIKPVELDFGIDENTRELQLINIGSVPAAWNLSIEAASPWMTVVSSHTGTTLPGNSSTVHIRVQRAGKSSGLYEGALTLTAGNTEQNIPVNMVVGGADELSILTPTLDFGSDKRHLTCILANHSNSALKWAIGRQKFPAILKRIYPLHGKLGAGEQAYLNVSIDRRKIPAGNYSGAMVISSKAGPANLTINATRISSQTKPVYVDVSAAGLNNGSSWKNAYRSLKMAIERSGTSRPNQIVEIWVAQGTYYENQMYVSDGMHLYGGFRGDEVQLEERGLPFSSPTIIDGQSRGRCFECGHRTVIDGFVIQNGRDWGSGDGKGAAILAYDNDVRIRNNFIRKNVDSWAGALFVEGFEPSKKVPGASPIIERNVLSDNFSNYCAAAIEVRGTEAIVRNNTIVRNQGFGLEIQDLLGPYDKIVYGKFYNNIVTENYRKVENDVWAEARKTTDYSYVGNKWSTSIGQFKPYDHGMGNIFGDEVGSEAGFVDMRNDNFRLKSNSLCIDAGDPASGADMDGSPPDLGAFPFNKKKADLEISPAIIDFGSESRRRTLTISAFGGADANWRAEIFSTAGKVLNIEPSSGTLSNGQRRMLSLSLDRNGLKDGSYSGYIAIMTQEESYESKFTFISNNSLPEIAAEPEEIKITMELTKKQPRQKRIQINNAVIGNLSWKAELKWNHGWLRIDPAEGRDSEFLTLNFSAENLSLGDYQEEVMITAAGAVNNPLVIPVQMTVKAGRFIAEIQAESSASLPNTGWKSTLNNSEGCVQALMESGEGPDDAARLDYEFRVPEGVDHVYVFAEVDVNGSPSNDSFWTMINGYDPCDWNYVNTKHDGWTRSWIYNSGRDKQHTYVVTPGVNKLNLFSREKGAFVNWFVVTNDPDINIKTYQFGK